MPGEPLTAAGRTFREALRRMDALDDPSHEHPVDWDHGIALVEQEAVIRALRSIREEVEGLNWFEPGLDGCEAHQPNWDWGPDQWTHLSRAAVLALLDRALGEP